MELGEAEVILAEVVLAEAGMVLDKAETVLNGYEVRRTEGILF
jgi:hypothetical protein